MAVHAAFKQATGVNIANLQQGVPGTFNLADTSVVAKLLHLLLKAETHHLITTQERLEYELEWRRRHVTQSREIQGLYSIVCWHSQRLHAQDRAFRHMALYIRSIEQRVDRVGQRVERMGTELQDLQAFRQRRMAIGSVASAVGLATLGMGHCFVELCGQAFEFGRSLMEGPETGVTCEDSLMLTHQDQRLEESLPVEGLQASESGNTFCIDGETHAAESVLRLHPTLQRQTPAGRPYNQRAQPGPSYGTLELRTNFSLPEQHTSGQEEHGGAWDESEEEPAAEDNGHEEYVSFRGEEEQSEVRLHFETGRSNRPRARRPRPPHVSTRQPEPRFPNGFELSVTAEVPLSVQQPDSEVTSRHDGEDCGALEAEEEPTAGDDGDEEYLSFRGEEEQSEVRLHFEAGRANRPRARRPRPPHVSTRQPEPRFPNGFELSVTAEVPLSVQQPDSEVTSRHDGEDCGALEAEEEPTAGDDGDEEYLSFRGEEEQSEVRLH
eukprot:CAMPEP_0202853092 /NCGR_PEP_ID=MMETSP1389-20130828/90304_1 /ASSEMBLY_ACC=CAM_ASM_000865 /TAXON_ID=302021 /ORGANISM="Rhodomonas sp., Strain CCMP768" /LENGTH=493 /DNA_ID=CAMNT_0049531631 /DNA_START=113 /DNA_END=1591 /DNA_ORIENTATION=-